MPDEEISTLIERLLNKDIRAVAKLISLVEDDLKKAGAVTSELIKNNGNARIIGITGPPGTGKSTLIDQLISQLRSNNKKVGVLAIDPSSPYSGGAILGDRIRMKKHSLDDEVYIRSMGTRGHHGGISLATSHAVKVLDAYGCDYVIVETVGVGQIEVEIVKVADVTVLVLMPGLGDDIQTMKAGIMEIADMFVINKSDKPGCEQTITDIKYMMKMSVELSESDISKMKPIVKTIATENEGIIELNNTIDRIYDSFRNNGTLIEKRKMRMKQEIFELVKHTYLQKLKVYFQKSNKVDDKIKEVVERRKKPMTLVNEIINDIKI